MLPRRPGKRTLPAHDPSKTGIDRAAARAEKDTKKEMRDELKRKEGREFRGMRIKADVLTLAGLLTSAAFMTIFSTIKRPALTLNRLLSSSSADVVCAVFVTAATLFRATPPRPLSAAVARAAAASASFSLLSSSKKSKTFLFSVRFVPSPWRLNGSSPPPPLDTTALSDPWKAESNSSRSGLPNSRCSQPATRPFAATDS